MVSDRLGPNEAKSNSVSPAGAGLYFVDLLRADPQKRGEGLLAETDLDPARAQASADVARHVLGGRGVQHVFFPFLLLCKAVPRRPF